MKKMLAIIAAIAVSAPLIMTTPAYAAAPTPPIIFFSDLSSGPNTGGAGNNGVFVTIAGKNFGFNRGSVTVGGSEASSYPVWTDTKISFQIGSGARSGNIVVKTGAGESNGVPFTVRPGRIFFVSASSPNDPGSGSYEDPWRSPASYFAAQQPGDTCYFRKGLYNGRYGSQSRSYNVSFYNTPAPSGGPNNEIAWVGYPGETAQFRADGTNGISNGAFEMMDNKQHYVIAGLSIYGKGDGREQVRLYSDNLKLANNKIEGIKTLSYAMVGVTAANIKIWGNEMFGATSANKLDHIVYFQGGGHVANVDVGWNYIHDNDIGPGPIFSWNLGAGSSPNVEIHDNKIDARKSSDALRLAGQWSGADGSTTFTNNIVIGAGASLNDDTHHVIYVGFGKAFVYHNTFYKSRGVGPNSVVHGYNGGSVEAKGNIFCNENSIGYVSGNVSANSNLYCGGSGNPPADDKGAVTGEPNFVNPNAVLPDLHIRQGSPAIAKSAVVNAKHAYHDFDGVPRAGGRGAIGALEYFEGGALPQGSSGITVNGDELVVPAGQIAVLGSTEGRGTVNPARGETVKIFFQGSDTGKFACRIFTLTGEMVWDSSQDNVNGGKFEWAPGSVASGIYVANVRGPGLSATKKIAILS